MLVRAFWRQKKPREPKFGVVAGFSGTRLRCENGWIPDNTEAIGQVKAHYKKTRDVHETREYFLFETLESVLDIIEQN